jgi:spore cortex biosynthesis protein YabQ
LGVTDELIAFIYFAISGMISGCIFDLFRCKRKNFKTKNFVVYMEDMFFWIIIGGLALYTSYVACNGQIRVYMLISMLLGSIIYFLTFSKLCYKVFELLCRYIKRLLEVFAKMFRGGKNETKVQKA